jgi:hypothetical protein
VNSGYQFHLVFDSAADYAAAAEHLRTQGARVELVEPSELELVVTIDATDYHTAETRLSEMLPEDIPCAFC